MTRGAILVKLVAMRFDVPSHIQSQASTPEPKTHKKRRFLKVRKPKITPVTIIVASCVLLIASLGGLSIYLLRQNSHLKEQATVNGQTPNAANELLDKINKLYDLPKNETPTVATVKDITQLKGQAFFADAQNGDVVLVYVKNKFALIYRPQTNRIIKTGPVSSDPNQASTGTPPSASSTKH